MVGIAAVAGLFPSGVSYSVLAYFLYLPFWVMFAASCHRVIIVGEQQLPNRYGLYWSSQETRFALWYIGLALLMAAAMLLFGILVSLLSLNLLPPTEFDPMSTANMLRYAITYLFAVYFLMRFSLTLPAAALGHRVDFRDSWVSTTGYGWALAIAASIPVAIAWGVYWLMDKSIAGIDFVLVDGIYWLVGFAFGAVEIAVLSVAYKYLVYARP